MILDRRRKGATHLPYVEIAPGKPPPSISIFSDPEIVSELHFLAHVKVGHLQGWIEVSSCSPVSNVSCQNKR